MAFLEQVRPQGDSLVMASGFACCLPVDDMVRRRRLTLGRCPAAG
jgi:hypothetical protein